jgi:hypothetical protein
MLTPEGQLIVHKGKTKIPVSLRPCFPWSAPGTFLSLRNAENEEVLLVENLENLESGSRDAVTSALAEAEFTLEISKIHSIERHFEMRAWTVETRHGPRKFQIRIDDWPRRLPNGGLCITDLSGDLYTIRSQEALDDRSRKLLFAYAD